MSGLGLAIRQLGQADAGISYRNIVQHAPEFDAIIPRNDCQVKEIKGKEADDTDMVLEMRRLVHERSHEMRDVAKKLATSSRAQFCSNVYHFIYRHHQYKPDNVMFEELRAPACSWKHRRSGIDCDCMAVIAACLLLESGMFKHVYFRRLDSDGMGFSHVYVVVPHDQKTGRLHGNQYWVIDPVLHAFDQEHGPIINTHDLPIFQSKSTSRSIPGRKDVSLMGVNGKWRLRDLPRDLKKRVVEAQVIFYRKMQNTLHEAKRRAQANGNAAAQKVIDDAIGCDIDPYKWERFFNKYGIDLPNTEEDRIRDPEAMLNGLAGGGLNGFFKKAWRDVKKGANDVANLVKDTVETIGNVGRELSQLDFRNAWGEIKNSQLYQVVGDAAKLLIRYFPLSIIIRNGFLLAVRLNIGRMADKLHIGYMSLSEAQGILEISPSEHAEAVQKRRQVERMFIDTLQGKEGPLRNQAKKGFGKKPLFSGLFGADGLNGDPESINRHQGTQKQRAAVTRELAKRGVDDQLSPKEIVMASDGELATEAAQSFKLMSYYMQNDLQEERRLWSNYHDILSKEQEVRKFFDEKFAELKFNPRQYREYQADPVHVKNVFLGIESPKNWRIAQMRHDHQDNSDNWWRHLAHDSNSVYITNNATQIYNLPYEVKSEPDPKDWEGNKTPFTRNFPKVGQFVVHSGIIGYNRDEAFSLFRQWYRNRRPKEYRKVNGTPGWLWWRFLIINDLVAADRNNAKFKEETRGDWLAYLKANAKREYDFFESDTRNVLSKAKMLSDKSSEIGLDGIVPRKTTANRRVSGLGSSGTEWTAAVPVIIQAIATLASVGVLIFKKAPKEPPSNNNGGGNDGGSDNGNTMPNSPNLNPGDNGNGGGTGNEDGGIDPDEAERIAQRNTTIKRAGIGAGITGALALGYMLIPEEDSG